MDTSLLVGTRFPPTVTKAADALGRDYQSINGGTPSFR